MTEIEKILSEDNTENVILYDENNRATEFQQVAIIPLDGTVYVILCPVTKVVGVADDEGLVFEITNIDGDDCLVLSSDEVMIEKVFEEYYQLLRAENIIV